MFFFSTHVLVIVYNFSFTIFFFVMLNLLFEKLKSCPNVVDVRMVLCLFELMNL